jgi:hypothetical protein
MRVEGDQSLQNQIDFITSNVDPAALDSLTEIVSAFQTADGDINNAITTLADAAAASLSAEVVRAESAEASLASDLSSEASARIADVDAEESRAIEAEGSIVDRVSADLKGEINARHSADYSLEQLISSEVSRAEEAEASLATELSYEVSYLISNTDLTAIDSFAEVSDAVVAGNESLSTEISSQVESLTSVDTSLEAQLSSDIDSLADVDNATISLDTATNTIKLKQEIAAPDSGMYTFNSNVEVSDTLTVGGVDVMAEISSEISARIAGDESLEVALSTEVSYLLANTDLTAIDSFAEVSNELSVQTENFETIYYRKASFSGDIDGINSSYTLSEAVRFRSENVYLNGLLQEENVDYTITGPNGDIVTFTSAPETGDKVVIYGVY